MINNSKMESLKRSKELMGRPKKADVNKCKKHPKHQQSPGVCSLCLKERLTQLSNSSSSRKNSTTTGSSCCSSTSSSLSSYYSSSSASSCSSPTMHRYRFEKEAGKSASISFLLNGKNVLTKSRSLAFIPRMKSGVDNDNDKKKKGGFWSNLLRPRSKRKEETNLTHSRTMRETVNA